MADTQDWAVVAAGARTWGLLIAAAGLVSSLSRSVLARRGDLHEVRLEREEHEREAHARHRERDHEIRNALFAIEGATLTLERYRDDLGPDDQEHLAAAVAGGIEHLRGLLEPRRERSDPVDLRRLADERVALLRARGVAAVVDGEDGVLALGDEGLCGQVLGNLLANAVRHGDAGALGVTIQVGYEHGQARLRVHDRGDGVPAEARERVFEPGVRLHAGREGEGLGLSLARALARRQGGELWLQDPVAGAGACFVLGLPRGDAAPGGGEAVEEPEHLAEVGQGAVRPTVGERHGAAAARLHAVVERDHGRSRDRYPPARDDRHVEVSGAHLGEDDGDLGVGRQQRPETLSEQRWGGGKGDTETERRYGGRGHISPYDGE